jgi:hypothetical protein
MGLSDSLDMGLLWMIDDEHGRKSAQIHGTAYMTEFFLVMTLSLGSRVSGFFKFVYFSMPLSIYNMVAPCLSQKRGIIHPTISVHNHDSSSATKRSTSSSQIISSTYIEASNDW